MTSSDILKGIRVLDLSRLAPGPYGSMLLADMGADVVIVAGGPGSFPIECYGRGKSTVTLDLKSDVGKAAFLDLAKEADVVIEGYRPGVASRLGIGFEDLKVINERLIYCSLTGYGQDGPMALEAGHDLNYAALSGLIGAMGPADDAPQMPLNVVADFAGGGLYAAFAIVSALFERERSGLGQHLDVTRGKSRCWRHCSAVTLKWVVLHLGQELAVCLRRPRRLCRIVPQAGVLDWQQLWWGLR